MNATESAETLRLTLEVWHPGCWVLDVTSQVDVGCLGYAIYTREDGMASTHYTLYGDDQAAIEEGLSAIRDHPSVYSVSEMTHGYRHGSASAPGNATRDLLVEHDGETQISEAFTSRGFVQAAPVDAFGETERWTILSTASREQIRSLLDEIRDERDAEISVESITGASRTEGSNSLPLDRLSHRQREIFQLARKRGYYQHPKAITAGELATKLSITTSTFHEHLHKAEAKVLDLS
ncbi:bacterio-opsin activator [Haloferax sp. Atlit-4N]|uniref:helix-turn-helix domain-containing protein n=1 Tax=unclassified Haloferax TaxID=2625095 RepID=UPI000E255462|nr:MULTISPECIES: helix-turn-helix domain-containing protein [unclassified Haloferax]RDZ39529.1 bacterio-opsin activator [Haloferax sp. Atlit-19N]RDZ49985.1 bacterio-opsin activator [Haloferax sp. Atlit-4N]